MTPLLRTSWATSLADPQAFALEQDRLGQVWTLLGLASDIPNDGDWFRATLGGRSIFVQRFQSTIRAFENRCAHRFFPLRTAERGNGPIRCGFHDWMYDQDGNAVGIPMCREIFGKSPKEVGARLNPVEIATCGALIFGRFPGAATGDTLEQFLGDGFPILRTLGQIGDKPHLLTSPIKANWKLCIHITLDDYHIVAVHPQSFGKKGYLTREGIRYFRFGPHSAFFSRLGAEHTLANMAQACRDGTYRPIGYRIFNIFPNLIVLQFQVSRFWYVVVQQYLPEAVDRTLMRAWFFPAPFPMDRNPLDRWTRLISEPARALAVRYYMSKLNGEDQAVCERQQTVAHQMRERPILGAQEERIAWFEESYAAAMAGRR